MQFLPHLPLNMNAISLFGLTLVLGLIAGELVRRSLILPRISGYIAIGFLVGPCALNIVTPSLLSGMQICIEVSLGLILFELGRHLDLRWLRNDPGILYMSLFESILTFALVFSLFTAFNFSWLHAALVAAIAVATSPAVVMMVTDDLKSKGPMTRRTLILTSLNNIYAILLFTVLLPLTRDELNSQTLAEIIYLLVGSITLGILVFYLTLYLARVVGKQKENQFLLLVGSVMFAIGLAMVLKLSSMLALFTFGVATRNLNYNYSLMEIYFGWLAKVFIILLFVITGIHLQIKGLWQSTIIILAFIFLRTMAKSLGVWVFAKSSQLTRQQTWSLCFSLTPMAGLAIGMSNQMFHFNPNLGEEFMMLIATGIAIFNILGPIAVQFAFNKLGEAAQE